MRLKGLTSALLMLLVFSLTIAVSPPPSSCSGAASWERRVVVHAPAVARNETGYVGVMSKIIVTVRYPGSGEVYFATVPFAEVDMQASARVAVWIACELLGEDPRRYDFFIKVEAPTPIIGGPSAGALMTVAVIAALRNWTIFANTTMTGMINPDGTVGPVGGIFEKAQAVYKSGFRRFLIPIGQEVVPVVRMKVVRLPGGGILERSVVSYVNVTEYAAKHWGMEVIQVGDIAEAVYLMTGHRIRRPSPPVEMPAEVRALIASMYERLHAEAAELIKRADALLEDVKSPFLRRTLASEVKRAKALLREAERVAASGMYYVAASLAFQALHTCQYAAYACRVAAEGEAALDDIIAEVNQTLVQAEELVANLSAASNVTLSALGVLIGARVRIRDAHDFMQRAIEARDQGRIDECLRNLAIARWRARTAADWASLVPHLGGPVVDAKQVPARLAEELIYEAQSVVVYADKIITEAQVSGAPAELVQEAGEALDEAQRALGRQDHLLALALAFRALADAIVAMNLLAPSEQALRRYLQISRGIAASYIAEALQLNVTPILSLCYFEFAEYGIEHLKDYGYAFVLVNLKLSALYARTLTLLSGLKLRTSAGAPSPSQPTQPSTPPGRKPGPPSPPSTPSPASRTTKEFLKQVLIVAVSVLVGFLMGAITVLLTREKLTPSAAGLPCDMAWRPREGV